MHLDTHEWLEKVKIVDRFSCRPSTLAESEYWYLENGVIRHVSNRFFSMIGLKWEKEGKMCYQPFIDQSEIGTLGFIARQGDGEAELLCYAKIEPGNTGVVQIAPTCQATKSNLERVHGGAQPPYAEFFLKEKGDRISHSLQSEQGSRFFRKRNLNTVIFLQDAPMNDELHRWISLRDFQHMLAVDFMVNTDARSVICCSDWQRLFSRTLFPGKGGFREALRRSFEEPASDSLIDEIQQRIDEITATAPVAERCAIDTMPDWEFDSRSQQTISNSHEFILHIATHSETREVTDWDQPIFSTHDSKSETLFFGRDGALLKFGFTFMCEVGLFKGVELGPSVHGPVNAKHAGSTEIIAVNQSDEGGRFFHDVTRYSIHDIGEIDPSLDLIWLTLSEIQTLLPQGYFNNEARSVISLILFYA